jgi:predicted RNase H-like HicB family nuclease
MLTTYIQAAMDRAQYERLDDGQYYGEIPECPGVWADAATLEVCRRTLQEVLEGWIVLKLRDGDELPVISGVGLAVAPAPG